MKRIIEYPFHLGDLVGGTTHLDNAEFGAYMRLLFANIQSPSVDLPNDPEILRRFARCTDKQWAKLWPLIRDKFPETEDGTFSNKRVQNTVASIVHRSDVARNNKLKGLGKQGTTDKRTNDGCPANHITLEDISKDISSPPAPQGEGDEGVRGSLLPMTPLVISSPTEISYFIEGVSLTFDQFFEKFWQHYPKIRDKGHKGKARDALIQAIKKGGKHAEDWNERANAIAGGIKRYRKYCDRTGEKNPDAFRWLRDGGFDRPWDAPAAGRGSGYSLEAVHDQAMGDQTGRPEGREERLKRLGIGDDTSND